MEYKEETQEVVGHWYDLVSEEFPQVGEQAKEIMMTLYENGTLKFFTIDFTGIFAYMIQPNVTGGLTMGEMLFYIKPCYRGRLRLVRGYVARAEKIARESGCESIVIGDTIQAKGDLYSRVLMRFGYTPRSFEKKL